MPWVKMKGPDSIQTDFVRNKLYMYAENNQRTSDEIFLLSHVEVYGNNKAMVEFMKL